ncbi:uncharacterized protein LOC121504265 isoform X2 [Cheilinus undulatus]|uniref:uncharacterized protein LOC121504265 isoform X2 n=1 Tax=Cheilinus undulatus TaxID=241271 RepID=UPI001BD48450|nr:uncharacterized protein LOC121504265 isoform X2 [Cheilinus undulatus]
MSKPAKCRMSLKVLLACSRLALIWTIAIHVHGSETTLFVEEDQDVLLPCSLSSKENIKACLFDWKKDGHKEVFMYDSAARYDHFAGQDPQFVGRVSHFEDELKNGNASIKITKAKVADSGNYTCNFLCLQPSQTFHVQLVVGLYADRVEVKEGSDTVLKFPLSSRVNIQSGVFDCNKDGKMEVYFYDEGLYSGHGRNGQDDHYKGRVSHSQEELQHGKVLLKIIDTRVEDSGNYTCIFPRPEPRREIHVQLVVAASPRPSIEVLNQTQDWAVLQCKVQGASPKPSLKFQDSSGNPLYAEESPQPHTGGKYDMTIQATVNKTDHYRCVLRQEEINHEITIKTFVYIHDKVCEDPYRHWFGVTGWTLAVLLPLSVAVPYFISYCIRVLTRVNQITREVGGNHRCIPADEEESSVNETPAEKKQNGDVLILLQNDLKVNEMKCGSSDPPNTPELLPKSISGLPS